MCRLVVFSGACTRCGESFTWDDLSQQLSCLEAKNKDAFGECRRGAQLEEHSFDQECDACAAVDEGIGDLEEDELQQGAYYFDQQQPQLQPQHQQQQQQWYSPPGSSSFASQDVNYARPVSSGRIEGSKGKRAEGRSRDSDSGDGRRKRKKVV